MNKLITVVLLLVCSLTLSACNREENEDIFFEIVELENSNNLSKEAVCKYKNYFSKCSVCSK